MRVPPFQIRILARREPVVLALDDMADVMVDQEDVQEMFRRSYGVVYDLVELIVKLHHQPLRGEELGRDHDRCRLQIHGALR